MAIGNVSVELGLRFCKPSLGAPEASSSGQAGLAVLTLLLTSCLTLGRLESPEPALFIGKVGNLSPTPETQFRLHNSCQALCPRPVTE